MKESSGSQFFKTTTGIQSRPDTFDASRFATTFFTVLSIPEILCSFKLVLEVKTGKEIPELSRLEFLDLALSYADDNTSRPLNRGGIADLTLLTTLIAICQKSWETSFWELRDPFVLLAYASFTASRPLWLQLLTCLNFTLDSEDLFS